MDNRLETSDLMIDLGSWKACDSVIDCDDSHATSIELLMITLIIDETTLTTTI